MSQFKLVGAELVEIPTPYILIRKGTLYDTYLVVPHGGGDGVYLSKKKENATGFETKQEAEEWAWKRQDLKLEVIQK